MINMIPKINTSNIRFTTTLVTFLEMRKPPAEKLQPLEGVSFRLLARPIDVNAYREYYYGVGEKHYWLDRMIMPDEELSQKINADNIDIFLMHVNNAPAGYAEFIKNPDFTEILYFGLLPDYIGKGLGKFFLRWATEQAWSYGPKWIQLNTCQLDHPHALENYKKNGFQEVRTEIHQRRILIPSR